MATILESNKSKIAKRVIEVFEYFDEDHDRATVMDIVRRYGRPQSSTSELLVSLVEMGLLYKDSRARYYFPTPRIASLGLAAQPKIIRNGRLNEFMEDAAQHGCAVALLGVVGVHAQIFHLCEGDLAKSSGLSCGSSELLSASAAGLLLLSTEDEAQAERVLWRLNAEADAEHKFNHADMCARVAHIRETGCAMGDAGFSPDLRCVSILVPCEKGQRPLALSAFYSKDANIDADAIRLFLSDGLQSCMDGGSRDVMRPLLRVANG